MVVLIYGVVWVLVCGLCNVWFGGVDYIRGR